MADVFPNEAYPSDATVGLLDGGSDQATGLPYIAKGVGPASTPSYEIQYNRRLERQNRRLAIVTAGLVVDEGGLKIGVYPFDYRLGGQFKHFDGATNQAVTDDATRFIYVDSANALQIAASEPADLTSFLPLAQVVATSGLISITPRSNYARLTIPQLGATPAGDGLTLSAGVLAVSVDGVTIETASDALQLKDDGITAAKLAAALAAVVPQVAITVGAEDSPAADDRVITLQMQDAQAVALSEHGLLRVWISTVDFNAPSASGNTVTVTTGIIYETDLANAAYVIIADPSGTAAVKINITGTATRYIMVELDGRIYSSGAVTWDTA
ncbi:MAG: hypothetical protein V3T70_01140 [Phycisphaerae bacterium]